MRCVLLYEREFLFLVSIGDATFSFQHMKSSEPMHSALHNPGSTNFAFTRAGFRTPTPFTRVWTGRARVSTKTDTLVPRCAASTTRRTRVSDMRFPVSDEMCSAFRGAFVPRASTPRRISGVRCISIE